MLTKWWLNPRMQPDIMGNDKQSLKKKILHLNNLMKYQISSGLEKKKYLVSREYLFNDQGTPTLMVCQKLIVVCDNCVSNHSSSECLADSHLTKPLHYDKPDYEITVFV